MKNRRLIIRAAFLAVLLAVAGTMMVIGRGHTVYFDNKTLEYNGQTYTTPYKVVVYVRGKQVAKLYNKERGMTTNIGQRCGFALGITREKGGQEEILEASQQLPYSMDGVIINLPGYLAGLPEDAYISEFVATPTEEELAPEGGEEGEDVMSGAEF